MADSENYSQAQRLLEITTPLGKDVLLLGSFSGTESISSLFQYRLELGALNTATIDFEKILGQSVTIEVRQREGATSRFFNGIVSRFARVSRDNEFTNFEAEIVPKLWLLNKRKRSRIFQHISVPDILKKVLAGIDTKFKLQGNFEPRDYCVQYRETDFEFISRMLEEEGMYYYFSHSSGGHEMIVANTPQSHAEIPCETELIFEELTGGGRPEERINGWEKVQELRSGKVTLWDHCFELPHKHLEASRTVQETVQVGTVTHKLKLANNEQLEIYDYPGAYAQRFDGVNSAGGETPAEIQKIFQDNKRTVDLRMDQEAALCIETRGGGNCTNMTAGHKFKLTNHYQDNGTYVITFLQTSCAERGNFRSSSDGDDFKYSNSFSCIPFTLPFRPQRNTPKPFIHGTQTAVVVGPAGEEIYTDKYGRVKVQFHWDQEGKNDASSSCWIRVGMPWAGKNWGFLTIPRIGHEVVVSFEEGDPDRPIIVGSVYNADMMPPYTLPEHKTKSTMKSRSSIGGGGFNEIRFEDKKGSEQIFLHAEKNLDIRVKNDRMEWIGRDRHQIVKRDKMQEVERDLHQSTKRDHIEQITRDRNLTVKGKEAVEITGSQSVKVKGAMTIECGQNISETATGDLYLKGKQVVIEATTGMTLKVGGNFITIDPSMIAIKGTMVMLNSGGAALPPSPGQLVPPAAVGTPAVADDATPGGVKTYSNQGASQTAVGSGGGAGGGGGSASGQRSDAPWKDSQTETEKKHWVEIELVDTENKPVPGEFYKITLPDGQVLAEGTLDEKGCARVENIDPGTCKVEFPNLDKTSWKPL